MSYTRPNVDGVNRRLLRRRVTPAAVALIVPLADDDAVLCDIAAWPRSIHDLGGKGAGNDRVQLLAGQGHAEGVEGYVVGEGVDEIRLAHTCFSEEKDVDVVGRRQGEQELLQTATVHVITAQRPNHG